MKRRWIIPTGLKSIFYSVRERYFVVNFWVNAVFCWLLVWGPFKGAIFNTTVAFTKNFLFFLVSTCTNKIEALATIHFALTIRSVINTLKWCFLRYRIFKYFNNFFCLFLYFVVRRLRMPLGYEDRGNHEFLHFRCLPLLSSAKRYYLFPNLFQILLYDKDGNTDELEYGKLSDQFAIKDMEMSVEAFRVTIN